MSIMTTAFSVEQFPYRATSPEHQIIINGQVSEIMRAVEDMVYQLTRKRARNQVDDDQVNEIVQRCMIWMWQKSLPKYDALRTPRVKVSTFIYRCAQNFIKQEIRSIMRGRLSKRRITYIDPDLMLQSLQAQDTTLDEKIHSLANDVQEHPEKYLTEAQVAVFNAIVHNKGELMKDLAVKLGYKRASSLSMMKRRIFERIAELDIEEYEPGAKTTKLGRAA